MPCLFMWLSFRLHFNVRPPFRMTKAQVNIISGTSTEHAGAERGRERDRERAQERDRQKEKERTSGKEDGVEEKVWLK